MTNKNKLLEDRCADVEDFPTKDDEDVMMSMLRNLYEWGSYKTFDITYGYSAQLCSALDKLIAAGFVAYVGTQNRREVYITTTGMKLIES
jgi:hypothetical protein